MAKKKAPPKELKPKKVDARIVVVKANRYRGTNVIIRQIDEEIFEFLVPYKGEVYSGNLIIKPKKGSKKLTKNEVHHAVGLIYAGAMSTVDSVIKGESVSEKDAAMVEEFEKAGKQLNKANGNLVN